MRIMPGLPAAVSLLLVALVQGQHGKRRLSRIHHRTKQRRAYRTGPAEPDTTGSLTRASDTSTGRVADLEPPRSSVQRVEAPTIDPSISPTEAAGLALPDSAHDARDSCDLGWLPWLSTLAAVGLLLVAFADTGARDSQEWAQPLFWAGLLTLFAPIALRMISSRPTQRERIGLVLVVGLALYGVKLLYSPLRFSFHDEFLHWATANDIVDTGHLFHSNSLLPISPLFPGLENVTAAVAVLTGLPVFSAGVLVLASARVVLVLALYGFFLRVSHSPRMSGIASLLYVANPNYVFFDAQFGYESLALPLATMVLYAQVRGTQAPGGTRFGLSLLSLLTIAALSITHHVTMYALTGFLVVWTVIAFLRTHSLDPWGAVTDCIRWYGGDTSNRQLLRSVRSRITSLAGHYGGNQLAVTAAALLAIVGSLTWTYFVAAPTSQYLSGSIIGGVRELARFLLGEQTGRVLFRSYGGDSAPLWEQAIGFMSVGLLLVPLSWALIRVWQRYSHNPVALTLGASALLYPLTLAFRLTDQGAQISSRAWEFLFVSIAFVLAVVIEELALPPRHKTVRAMTFTVLASIVFVGGLIIGRPDWMRMPGPYLVGADPRSIESQGIAAAQWSLDALGPGRQVLGDRVSRLLMATYGHQRPITEIGNLVVGDGAPIFFTQSVEPAQVENLRRVGLEFIVVDRRMSLALPKLGFYFGPSEPDSFRHTQPIDPVALRKFDSLRLVSRVFDSGDIVIYNVVAFLNAQ